MAEATAQKKKSGNKIAKFFKEVKSEMKKVVWPSKNQVVKSTFIVIAAVVVIGILIWVLDILFQLGLSKFIAR